MNMRIISSRLMNALMETHMFEFRKSALTKRKSSLHDFHIAFLDRMIHHRFILVRTNRASRVHDIAAYFTTIDGGEYKFFLHRTHRHHIIEFLRQLNRWIARNHTQTRAGRIQQHSIKDRAEMVAQLTSVQVTHDHILEPHSMYIAIHSFQSFMIHVIRDQHSAILHQLRAMRRLAPGRTTHVQHFLPRLDIQRQCRQQGSCALNHVIASQVFRGRTNRNGGSNLRPTAPTTTIDFESALAPCRQRVEIDTAVNQQLGQVTSSTFQSVRPNRERALLFIRFQERQTFVGIENRQKHIHQIQVIAIITRHRMR
mmetsp:Transcript_25833/g.42213  ORF Transcript_25833/g.42213 Transcript_25833/m.42213 type:complete len:312 (-) Transcript_25833:533-1468(-)